MADTNAAPRPAGALPPLEGSARLWGTLASHASITLSLLLAAGGLALGAGSKILDRLSSQLHELLQIDLSPLEFAIVAELMAARGQPVTKTMLWDRCWVEWKFLPDNFVNIIDARISALRRRLKEQAPELGDDLHPLIVSARSQSLIFRDLSDWTE